LDFIKEENEIQRYSLYFRSILCLQDCCSCTNQLLPIHPPELRKKKTNDAGILCETLEVERHYDLDMTLVMIVQIHHWATMDGIILHIMMSLG
jgi:hypothetical protein